MWSESILSLPLGLMEKLYILLPFWLQVGAQYFRASLLSPLSSYMDRRSRGPALCSLL